MEQSLLEKISYAHMPPTRTYQFEYESEKCTHCRLCTLSCPTSCLQWNEDKQTPYATGLSDIELACIGCNNCEVVCPALCIRMRGDYRVLIGRYKTPKEKYGDMLPPCPFGKTDLNRNFESISTKLTDTEKIIFKRRSVRLYKDKPVEKELLHRILEAGRFAPSAGNGQPLKFLVVTDKKINRKVDKASAKVLHLIKKTYSGTGKWRKFLIGLLSLISVNKWDQRPIAAMEKVDQTNGMITFNAPVVIHVLKDKRGISHPDVDAAIAAQNIVLTAHAIGLGTCYIGFIASTAPYARAIKKILGITYPYEIVTSICVGYPKIIYDKPVPRGRVPMEWIE